MQVIDIDQKSSERRIYYLDWLRIYATLLLFIFHTARCFDVWEINYIENSELSSWITLIFVWVIDIFHMPLFFFIAGASSKLALQRISYVKYSKNRFNRLFIPFIFGLLIIVPPQPFLAAKYFTGYSGTIFDFYLTYFQTGFQDITGYRGTFTPAHLWFIIILFALSIISIPFFKMLNSPRGVKLIEKYFHNLNFIRIFIIPTIIIAISLISPRIVGKNIVYYFVIFLLGFLIIGNSQVEEFILQKRKIWLIISIIGLIFVTVYYAVRFYSDVNFGNFHILFSILDESITMWAIILVSLGYSNKYLNKSNKIHEYFTRASYPLYILHQTVIIVVAYFVVQWSVIYWVKFILIILLAFGGSMIIYELIRRIKVLNWAFGMKNVILKRKKKEED
ncbi:acyltransferase family protein [Promethearchaeum syntrophicum]|uniref:Acyltransferase family protein n=1 Tax=Promethearchaeum syntrophicum TaxID=2594042 RepID=A0A5B9DG35_9ARCH|nr:acyltransferase family protein [Candidatus Prometheoarchaeum syntrophicum]QEE18084.1 glucans biosynthesis protein [Candidatus Prometheoarchaeum syntrophicum]